jgi:hypothetical protein
MKKIPTAEEFLPKNSNGMYSRNEVEKAMIDFAKLHVEAALAEVGCKIIGPAAGSIKDMYPQENIK